MHTLLPIDIRTLKVGDIVHVPSKAPFPTHHRVYRGVENRAKDGKDNPYIITISHTRIFPYEIKDVQPWQQDDHYKLPHWLRNKYTLGDPLFGTNNTIWKYNKNQRTTS